MSPKDNKGEKKINEIESGLFILGGEFILFSKILSCSFNLKEGEGDALIYFIVIFPFIYGLSLIYMAIKSLIEDFKMKRKKRKKEGD